MPENIRRTSHDLRKRAEDYFTKGEVQAGELAQSTAERIDLAIDVANQHTSRDAGNVAVEDLGAGIAGLYKVGQKKSSIDKEFILNSSSHMAIAHVLVHEEGGHHDSRVKGDSHTIDSVAVEEGLNELATGQELGHGAQTYEKEQVLVHQIARQTQTDIQSLISQFQHGQNADINRVVQQAANDNESIGQQLAA